MDAVLYLLEVEVRIYSVTTLGSLPSITKATPAIIFPLLDRLNVTIDREVEQDTQVIVQLDLAQLRSLIYFFLYLIHLR